MRGQLLQDISRGITLSSPPETERKDQSQPNFVRRWTPKNHKYHSKQTRSEVVTILLLAQKRNSGEAYHPEAPFWRLPQNVLYLIFHFLVSPFDARGITQFIPEHKKKRLVEGIDLQQKNSRN